MFENDCSTHRPTPKKPCFSSGRIRSVNSAYAALQPDLCVKIQSEREQRESHLINKYSKACSRLGPGLSSEVTKVNEA